MWLPSAGSSVKGNPSVLGASGPGPPTPLPRWCVDTRREQLPRHHPTITIATCTRLFVAQIQIKHHALYSLSSSWIFVEPFLSLEMRNGGAMSIRLKRGEEKMDDNKWKFHNPYYCTWFYQQINNLTTKIQEYSRSRIQGYIYIHIIHILYTIMFMYYSSILFIFLLRMLNLVHIFWPTSTLTVLDFLFIYNIFSRGGKSTFSLLLGLLTYTL